MPLPFQYYQKTPKQVHDDGIRTLANGLRRVGITNPNVGPGSDYDLQWTAIGNEVAVAQANAVIQADGLMPDTATGSNLDRWLTLLGLARNGPVGSAGNVTVTLSVSSTFIAVATQLTDGAGLRYQVSVGGTYATGALVPVTAIDTGIVTNHSNGDTLNWVVPPFGASPTVTVGSVGGTDGLSGGSDTEIGNDNPPRSRLFSRLQNPPGGGNWPQVAGWAAASTPLVGLACVYPALNGPATVYVSVSARAQTTGTFTSSSFSRVISGTIVSSIVAPYVQGLLPENVFNSTLSTVDSPTDVQIALSIPASPTASPPGPGGGWLDGTPWPFATNNAGSGPTTVTAVASSVQVTVNASTSPTAGVTHVSWLSPNNWTVFNSVVTTVTGSAGAWTITLSSPLPGIAVGNFLFPTAVNTQTYVTNLLNSFAAMGPGEWTSNANVLPRAFRHPIPSTTAPYSLGGSQLKSLENSSSEVTLASYIFTSQTTPAVPASLSVAPNILTPRNLGFYLK